MRRRLLGREHARSSVAGVARGQRRAHIGRGLDHASGGRWHPR